MTVKKLECEIKLSRKDIHKVLTKNNLLLRTSPSWKDDSSLLVLDTDSRTCGPHSAFLAIRGTKSDGHAFISKLVSTPLFITEEPLDHGHWLQVKDTREAWGYLASYAFGTPETSLTFLGVTGTNGKTSTTWLCRELLKNRGIKCAVIGTLGLMIEDDIYPTDHTTPDPNTLFSFLAECRRRGVFHIAMEVSSHAIAQKKLGPIRFKHAAFTSFSRDHLDYHKTLEEYLHVKCELFQNYLKPSGTSFLCDKLPKLPLSGIYYGEHPQSELRYKVINRHSHISTVEICNSNSKVIFETPFAADHAIENLLAAILLTETPLKPELLTNLSQVPGRLEIVPRGQGPLCVIDYAHTPDALEKTLQAVRRFAHGRLICIFGCGGNRDKGKRPLMAKISEKNADYTVITSDNPRLEDPNSIIQDILSGMNRPEHTKVIMDRALAIEDTIKNADKTDTILIAGKGHETYQIIGTDYLPFDDRELAKLALYKYWSKL